jgi:hypothetical protein
VLQNGFGRIPVVYFGYKSSPGYRGGFDHTRVSEPVHGRQGRLRGVSQKTSGCSDACFYEGLGGEKLASADFRHFGCVYGRHTVVLEDLKGVQCPGVIDTAFYQYINVKAVLVEIEELLSVVYLDQFDLLAVPEFRQKQLFLFSDDGMQKTYFHYILRIDRKSIVQTKKFHPVLGNAAAGWK